MYKGFYVYDQSVKKFRLISVAVDDHYECPEADVMRWAILSKWADIWKRHTGTWSSKFLPFEMLCDTCHFETFLKKRPKTE